MTIPTGRLRQQDSQAKLRAQLGAQAGAPFRVVSGLVGLGLTTAVTSGGAEPFATLDRYSGGSHVDGSIGLTRTEPGGPDVALRFDVRGQFTDQRGVGAYASLPLSVISGPVDEAALGNLEIGGLYATAPLVFRAGLVLDTSDDSSAGRSANSVNALGRVTDVSSVISDVTWLRFSVSPVVERGWFFLRFDSGLDIPLGDAAVDLWALARLNGGVGARLGQVALTGELVTVGRLGDNPTGDDWVHTAALSLSGRGRATKPYLALVVPLGDTFRYVARATWVVGAQWSL